MTKISPCSGVVALVLLTTSALAQTASDTPAAPSQAEINTATKEVSQAHSEGRHLAPPDTFYLLDYVSAKTDKGVIGFVPGQMVHLVKVNRDNHTLEVGDNTASVEVSPGQLTNDLDLAAAAKQKDQASQARIVAYRKAEQEAYDKFEREAAAATQKDIQRREQQQQQQAQLAIQAGEARAQEQAEVVQAGNVNTGYYGYGGYGYGSPYAYFATPSVGAGPGAVPSRATGGAAPTGNAGGGRANPASVGTATRAGGGRP